MDIREYIDKEDYQSLSSLMMDLRDKLWKEDKIKIDGYTYSEWKEKQVK